MFPNFKTRLLVAVLGGMAAVASAQGPQWGGVDDVPTYQPGESWPFRRSFKVNISTAIEATAGIIIGLDAKLTFSDVYTLEVDSTTPIIDATPSIGSYTEKAYLRKRTAGTITIGGSATAKLLNSLRQETFPGEKIVLTLNLPSGSSKEPGSENWIGVSDLSQIRERFVTPNLAGTVTVVGYTNGIVSNANSTCSLVSALGITCGGTPIAFVLGIDLGIDHYTKKDNYTTSGLELVDFPTVDPFTETPDTFPGGEQNLVSGRRAIFGHLHLEVPSFSLNSDLDLTNISTPINYLLRFEQKNVPDPYVHLLDNRKIIGYVAPNDDAIYYSPAAKEFSYWRIGNLTVNATDLTVQLQDFITNTRAPGPGVAILVKPDGDITNLVIDPERPSFGQKFEVSGFAGSTTGTLITATLLRPLGLSDIQTTQTTVGGAFTVRLTAPLEGDNSPSDAGSHEPEFGSFGIQLVRAGSTTPYNRKLVTVRLDAPLAAKEWNRYE